MNFNSYAFRDFGSPKSGLKLLFAFENVYTFDISAKMNKQGISGFWEVHASVDFRADFTCLQVFLSSDNHTTPEGTKPLNIQFVTSLLTSSNYLVYTHVTTYLKLEKSNRYELLSILYTEKRPDLYNERLFTVQCLMFFPCCSLLGKSSAVASTEPAVPWKIYKSLFNDFNKVFTEDNTDTILCVGEDEVKAHRLVLCARSPVFAEKFEYEVQESEDYRIDISGIPFPVVEAFVCYLYSTELPDMNLELACGLCTAAYKYKVFSLQIFCDEFLVSKLSEDNVCSLINLADDIKDTLLMATSMKFVVSNLDVTDSREWKSTLFEKPHLTAEFVEAVKLSLLEGFKIV